MTVKLSALLELTQEPIEVIDHGIDAVATIANLGEATPSDMAYVLSSYPAGADTTQAGMVVTDIDSETLETFPNFAATTWLITPTPRLIIAQFSGAFAPEVVPGVHPLAVVDPEAILGDGVVVGPNATIGAHVAIGVGTVVAPGVHIAAGSVIGAECMIGPGSVIGHNAFAYQKTEDRWLLLESLGRVVVGDRVELGANVCVDRGNWGDTLIGDDVKIDNLSHIGHDARIERMAVITAKCILAGYVHVQEGAWLSPGTAVKARATIERNAFTGLGATVVRDVDEGTRVAGNPARPFPKQ